MLMDRGLKMRLRVLIPAVENAISGAAFRPRDIYRSRKGITVEIGNTDAEGGLILADALALADEEEPELIADMATLTGAARVALGAEIPPFYTDDDDAGRGRSPGIRASENDPLWRMPLWRPYDQLLDSKVADINNVANGSFGGSITAALFLRRFVTRGQGLAALRHLCLEPDRRSRDARKAPNARPRARSTRCCLPATARNLRTREPVRSRV